MVEIMTDQSLALEVFLKHTYEDVEKKINEIITDQNILSILKRETVTTITWCYFF